jgi:hypothetical protein
VSDRSSTLARVTGVLVILGTFIGTKQIAAPELDALAIVAALVALTCGVLALYVMTVEYKTDPAAHPVLPAIVELMRIGAIVAGGLAIFGIWRTVVPGFVGPTYTDPVLGLSLIVLLVAVFYLTRPVPGVVPGAAGGAGGPIAPASPAMTSPAPIASVAASASGEASGPRATTVVGTIVAIAVVIAYGAVIVTLLQQSSVDDKVWARLVDIQGGLQAAAFAALGALIGVTVQARSTDAATAVAAAATTEAAQSADDAALAAQQASDATAKTAQLTSTLKAVDAGLTTVERDASDEAIPSGLNTVEFQNIVADATRDQGGEHFLNLRPPAANDKTIIEVRRLRDLIREAL